jgi:hypothetical protein
MRREMCPLECCPDNPIRAAPETRSCPELSVAVALLHSLPVSTPHDCSQIGQAFCADFPLHPLFAEVFLFGAASEFSEKMAIKYHLRTLKNARREHQI